MDSETPLDSASTSASASGASTHDGSQRTPMTTPGSSRHTSITPQSIPHLSEGANKIVASIHNYLALGCLSFEDLLNPGDERELDSNTWQDLSPLATFGYDTAVASSLSKLLHSGWIRMQSTRCSYRPHWLIFRVYLLYQDVGLAEIDRSNRRLVSALECILQEINTEPRAWFGCYIPEEVCSFDTWATREEENPSLFYLFNKIASPKPSARAVREKYDREALEDMLSPHDNDNIPGMKTVLFPYQKRSAGAMLQRESVSQLDLDPRLEERKAPDGTRFYFGPRGLQFFREPKLWETPRGGVLAEGMGLGKTVICLSLILATKNHPPKIPKQYARIQVRPKVASLADMAVAAANRSSIPWKVEFDRYRAYGQDMQSCEDRLKSQPPWYEIPGVRHRWNRNTSIPTPQHLTMASTTIIVVPPHLIKQWRDEIDKHLEDGALNVLVVDDRKVLLPTPEKLRTYDIVLFTRNRFDLEDQDGQDSEGRRMSKVPLICTCPYKGATRIRNCNCLKENELYSSPLKKLHFKRLIVDEGHFFNSTNTSSTIRVAKNLVKADHRWVVSGTPAKDVLGVDIGLESANSRDSLLERRKTFDQKHDITGAADTLNALASNFLMSTPWKANDAKNYVYRHEDFRNKTYTGFSASFRRVLDSLVIKTRPEDVEIVIPPYTHTTVLLEPSYYDKCTANLFTLVLTANEVTSERTDADYLFHKNSAKDRYQLIANLRQSAFFWSGFSEADLHAVIQNSTSYLAKEGTGCTPRDRSMLSLAMDSAKTILASQGWKAMSRSHELGVFVDDWPEASAEHWAFDESTDPLMTGISQLLEAQKFVNFRSHLEDPGEGLSGAGVRSLATTRQQEVKAEEAEEGSQKAKLEKSILTKGAIPTSSLNGEPSLKRRASFSDGKPVSPRKLSANFKITKRRKSSPQNTNKTRSMESVTAGEAAARNQATAEADEVGHLPDDSPYAWTRVIGTTSSKLSYLLSQILEHYQEEKILVFYTGDNSAYYVAQFLELFNIKHEIYAKSLTAEKKARYVESFQKKNELRVLLMDVAQAALGLNICAASRIYFVNPICRPYLEAQAIKRAHRIGQTRKVTIETLVLRGSIEEKMLDRSASMTEAEHKDAKALEDDRGIRAIIQSAKPLSIADDEARPGAAQMAPLHKPERLWCRTGWREGTLAGSPSRKRKSIVLKDVTDANDCERLVHDDEGGDRRHPQVQLKRRRMSEKSHTSASDIDDLLVVAGPSRMTDLGRTRDSFLPTLATSERLTASQHSDPFRQTSISDMAVPLPPLFRGTITPLLPG